MKKILLLLCALLGMTAGAWADVLTLTPSNGTYVTSGGNYVNSITFSTTPAITVTASANNMDKRITDTYLQWHSGSSGSSTYTISVADDYVITSYSVTGEANTSAQTLTAGSVSHEFAVGTSSSFEVTGLESSSVSFVQTGANASGLKITSISVTVVKPTDEQIAAYNTVQGWVPTIQSAKGLVKDATNYFSNAKSSAEGSYEALLDGEYTTYFHGAYGSQSAPNEDQYLQATLPNAVNAIYFYFKKRSQNNNNRPTSITISGSNDGSSFTDITTINSGLHTDASVLDYTSSKINLGASYQYIRFTVTSTNNGATHSNGHVFFTFSEFYILPSETEVDNVMDLRASLAGTAAINYTAQNISDVTAANTALLSNVVDVTYNLYEADGVTLVDTRVVEQEKNSAVANPFTVSGYFDYAITGSIGTENCTINITRTPKNGVVYPLSNLSNGKSYYIKTRDNARSALSTTNGYLASPVKTALSISPKKFAIISYEDNYYLYSVEDAKFVTYSTGEEALLADVVTGTSDRIEFSETTAPLFEVRFDGSSSKILNSSANYTYGIVMNSWGASSNQWDDGCLYTIEAADDFDATNALAALEEFFHPTNCYDRVEAEVLPFLMDGDNPSPTIGKPFGLSTTAATSIVTTYMTQLNNKQFTLEEYEAIVAAKNAGIIYPEDGKFYVIKSVSNSNYINVKSAGGIYADANIPTPGSIVKAVVRGGHTYFATQGKEFGWCYGTSNKALLDAAGSGKYAHFADITVPGQIAFAHCIGNGEGPTYEGYLANSYYTVGENNQVCGGGANAPAAQWTFEEATSINVTVSSAGYATLYVPFAVTIPSGIKAYAVSGLSGNILTLAEIETTIPAGTPVILEGEANTYTFDITTGGSYEGDNKLEGTYLQKAADDGSYILQNQNDKVGFYLVDTDIATPNVPANRAYLIVSSPVKAFFFGEADGISAVAKDASAKDATIFNIAGQRVAKAQKGIYIVNGKKVLVK